MSVPSAAPFQPAGSLTPPGAGLGWPETDHPVLQNNPLFPDLRSGPTAVSGASRRKQIPSSSATATMRHRSAPSVTVTASTAAFQLPCRGELEGVPRYFKRTQPLCLDSRREIRFASSQLATVRNNGRLSKFLANTKQNQVVATNRIPVESRKFHTSSTTLISKCALRHPVLAFGR